MLKKNTAGQFIYFGLVSTVDGSAITGASPTGYLSIDGGAQGGIGGAIVGQGNGQYEVTLSQGDTNGDEIGYFFTNAGAIPVSITVTTETKKMADLNDLAAGAEMDLIDDCITTDKYDETSAYALESADTGASQVFRVGADGDTAEALSDQLDAIPDAAAINTQVDTALSDIHLDHLLAVDFDSESPVGNATSFFRQLVEDDSATLRFTTNTLEQAPGAVGDATEAKQDEILVDLVDIKGTAFSKDTHSLVDLAKPGDEMTLEADAIKAVTYDESTAYPLKANDAGVTYIARTGADGDTLEDISDEIDVVPDAAGIESECNDALVALQLDHIFAVAYTPASKPGHAEGLFNMLVENDSGVARYTANALEQSAITGGDATQAKQDEILVDIVDIKGTAFAKDTHSLVNQALVGADSDTLEDISDEIAAMVVKIDDVDTVVDRLMDITEGDHDIDDSGSPWLHTIKRKGTEIVLISKQLLELDDTAVTAITQVIAQELEE